MRASALLCQQMSDAEGEKVIYDMHQSHLWRRLLVAPLALVECSCLIERLFECQNAKTLWNI